MSAPRVPALPHGRGSRDQSRGSNSRRRTVDTWRRESQIVGFGFAMAEGIESAMPFGLPILSAFLGCVLYAPFELREARRQRRREAARQRCANTAPKEGQREHQHHSALRIACPMRTRANNKHDGEGGSIAGGGG